MRFVTDKASEEEYTTFLESHKRCNFQQSIGWAKVKNNWTREIILAEDSSGKIIGSLMVLIRKIPFFGNIMYSSRGPVCDIHNMEILKQLTEGVKELAKKYKAIVFRMEPDIESSDESFKNVMLDIGYQLKDDAKNFREEIQPRYVFRLDTKNKTEDELFKNLHSKTRYNVRLATKKGVVITEGKKEDIPELERLMKVTGERDGFPIRTKEYFEELYDVLGPKHFRITFAEYEGKKIAANVDFLYGDKVWYMYGASSNEQRNLMPTYLLQWDGIKWAIKNHCNVYDFRGICAISLDDKNRNEGLYRFKNGFNPDLIEFTEFYKVYNPILYFAFEKLFPLYRKIRVKLMGKKVDQN